MREWLLGIDPKLITLMQIGMSTLLSAAGFFLAVVVMYFGYRNNFGWKPSVMILRRWDGSTEGDEKHAGVEFEVWNRQKYPIILRVVEVDFGQARVLGPSERKMRDASEWEKFGDGRLMGRFDEVVEGSKHRRFSDVVGVVEYVLATDAFDGPETEVTVTFYDPRWNRLRVARVDSERVSKQWRRWRNRRGIGTRQ